MESHSELEAKIIQQICQNCHTQVSVDDINNEGFGVISDEIPSQEILWRREGNVMKYNGNVTRQGSCNKKQGGHLSHF